MVFLIITRFHSTIIIIFTVQEMSKNDKPNDCPQQATPHKLGTIRFRQILKSISNFVLKLPSQTTRLIFIDHNVDRQINGCSMTFDNANQSVSIASAGRFNISNSTRSLTSNSGFPQYIPNLILPISILMLDVSIRYSVLKLNYPTSSAAFCLV